MQTCTFRVPTYIYLQVQMWRWGDDSVGKVPYTGLELNSGCGGKYLIPGAGVQRCRA